jgi:nucleotide-binding universal stress UspA family protein
MRLRAAPQSRRWAAAPRASPRSARRWHESLGPALENHVPAPYRLILCPTDLSAAGDDAVDVAFALTQPGAMVHLLHVCEPGYMASPFDLTPIIATAPSPEALAALEKKVAAHLRRLVPEESLARNVRHQTHIVHDANPAGIINRLAQELKAEAIVMGTHGRTGLGRLVMGSVATDLLKTSKLPVVLVRNGRR